MISRKELKFRCKYFWYVFRVWLYDVLTYKTPKERILEKHLITYGFYVEDRLVEYHEGTLWEFVKWIITHESFDNLWKDWVLENSKALSFSPQKIHCPLWKEVILWRHLRLRMRNSWIYVWGLCTLKKYLLS